MTGFGPTGAAPIGGSPSPERINLDPSDLDVRRRLLAAGWLGEPLIDLFKIGDRIYYCWESEHEPRPRKDLLP